MFFSKKKKTNRKIMYVPENPNFAKIKLGFPGCFLLGTCLYDGHSWVYMPLVQCLRIGSVIIVLMEKC